MCKSHRWKYTTFGDFFDEAVLLQFLPKCQIKHIIDWTLQQCKNQNIELYNSVQINRIRQIVIKPLHAKFVLLFLYTPYMFEDVYIR